MDQLPPPVTVAHHYLKAIHDRQGEILEELRSLRQQPAPADQTVELKEPKRKAK